MHALFTALMYDKLFNDFSIVIQKKLVANLKWKTIRLEGKNDEKILYVHYIKNEGVQCRFYSSTFKLFIDRKYIAREN